ncbi:MAG: NADPH:quinone reductase [Acidobacteriaceae bacterium]|jgi:NADPH2:quinone reductase|nr:NADPH:quinone reductase [Acidobacteriaceae bacterium]
MRSIVVREFGGPEVMRVEETPSFTPSASQVVVRVRAAGVNPVDTYIRSGAYAIKPPLPFTPGIDGAGEIAAVGADVKQVKEGDRVYLFNDGSGAARTGTYAEYMLCAATQVRALPKNVSFEQGAALGVPYGTAMYALVNIAHARPGETVLVHGASGGVGIAAVQLAKAHGMTVFGTAGSERGIQAVKEQGADLVVNHHESGYLEKIASATGGRGCDVILEMNAHLNLDKDLTLLGRRGRVVLIGNRGRIEIDPRAVMAREAAVLGMVLFNVAAADCHLVHNGIVNGLATGALRPIVGQSFPLADAPLAHDAVMKPGALGKIVIVP